MAPIPAKRTFLRFLKSPYDVLNDYPKKRRPFCYERLVVQSFASLLNLPFSDRDNDCLSAPHRVTWFGSVSSSDKAPSNRPDGIAHAYKFTINIEATLTRGSDQCVREFGQALRHADRIMTELRVEPRDLYVVLVVRDLSFETFEAIKASNAKRATKVIPCELPTLYFAMETSLLADTMRHIELRQLLQDLDEAVRASANFQDFRVRAERTASLWQTHVLELEKATMLALRSYQAMLLTRRDHAGLSEILLQLQKDRFLKKYINKIGRMEHSVSAELIENSLLQESLGVVIGRLVTGERLFAPVSILDFRSRCNRRLTKLESIGASVR